MTAGVTFVVNTYNQGASVADCLAGVLAQRMGDRAREIVLVDDGSDDGTWETARSVLESAAFPARCVQFVRRGGVACRQYGFDVARQDLVLLLGGDFVLRDPDVVAAMLDQLPDGVPFVSLYGPHGGMGTLYRREFVRAAGGFDQAFNRFGSGFRDDSDLHYRLRDRGLTGRHLDGLAAGFEHRQPAPRGLRQTVAYAMHRVAVHRLDPLLFRKHPRAFAADFGVRGGVLVDPVGDFRRATGLWRDDGRFELSSPQGVTLVPGGGVLGRSAAVAGGIAYVVAVHLARISGSISYRVVLL